MGRKNNRATDEIVLSRKERRAIKLAEERYAIRSNYGQMPAWMRDSEHEVGQHSDGSWYLRVESR